MARQDTRTSNPGIVPHPAYTAWVAEWTKLLDVYEGAGGFADANRPYLYAHPREWLDHSTKIVSDENPLGKWISNPNPTKPSPKLKARRRIARYENVAATLIDQLSGALFRKPAARTFASPDTIPEEHPLKAFWMDADGLGRSIDACVKDWWTAAAVFGHVGLYGDLLRDAGPTQADRAPLIVRAYTPLDIIDWLTDDLGRLTAVRLLEAAPRPSFDVPAGALVSQVRDVDAEQWTLRQVDKMLRTSTENPVETMGQHNFGVLPFVVLYAKRRPLLPTVGRSVLGDPALYIDLYNLVSEVRELLRNQTFGILNVPLGNDGSIEREQMLIGETAGTANVLFSSQAADYISPDGQNVQMYHEHMDRLLRTIYRLAVVSWDSDSLDAESADSRKLKHEDLYQMLAGYAAECEQTERTLIEWVYRAHYGDQWQARFDADKPSVSYPDEFDVSGLMDEIEAATAALALELGETATKEVKKRAVAKILPGLPLPLKEQIDVEISEMDVKTQAQREMEAMQIRFGGAVPQGDGDPGREDEVPPA